jgi:hypothetical protein
MLTRLALIAVLLLGAVLAGPALAVEEGAPTDHSNLPSIDEIGTQSEISREFFPEPYTAPSVFDKLVYPLLIVAMVATLGVLALYLLWQPRFAEERKRRQRR